MADIEEHLGVTIDNVATDLEVPLNEFDGKVAYGQKRTVGGGTYKGHVEMLASAVEELAGLEKRAQTSFLSFAHQKPFVTA